VPRLVYLTGWALLLVAGAFLLTDWLLRQPPLGLKARCAKMLAMQIGVYNGTKTVAWASGANAGKQPSRPNWEDALALADEQQAIIREASQAVRMLEGEGSAVAFHEVFTQVRDDMKDVQRRLRGADAGKVTQAIQEDIIDTLREMIKALERAIQDLAPPRLGG
jgi:hypothetical protein